MRLGRWLEWLMLVAWKRAKDLRCEINAGGDPLGTKEGRREAPCFKGLMWGRLTSLAYPCQAARP